MISEALLTLIGFAAVTIIGILLFAFLPVILLHKLDKHVEREGSLLGGQVTNKKRVMAIVIGIIFAAISLYEHFFLSKITYLFPVMSFFLLDYGIRGKSTLSMFQGKKGVPAKQSNDQGIDVDEMRLLPRRTLLFLLKIALILVLSGLFLMCAWWVSRNPDNLISIIFVILVIVGFILLIPLGILGELIELIKRLSK